MEIGIWKNEIVEIGEEGDISDILEGEFAIILLVVTSTKANELGVWEE